MHLPLFTADLAVCRTSNIYREYSFSGLDATEEGMIIPAGSTIMRRPVLCHGGGQESDRFGAGEGNTGEGNNCLEFCGEYGGTWCADIPVCYAACPAGWELWYPHGIVETCNATSCVCNGVVCNTVCCTGGASCVNGLCQCPGGQSYENGKCKCPAGESLCDNDCTNTATDEDNCGACGEACGHYENCCNGVCTDYRDPDNCSSCGNVCTKGMVCQDGRSCACPNGQTPDFNTDQNNCGSCGSVCQEICSNGCCIGSPPPLNSLMQGGGNYLLFSPSTDGCQPIDTLSVSMVVGSELISTASPNPSIAPAVCSSFTSSYPNGLTLQLNAIAMAGSVANALQYVFLAHDDQITAQVFYFLEETAVVDMSFDGSFPDGLITDGEIPANFSFNIQLLTDENGFVTAVDFNIAGQDEDNNSFAFSTGMTTIVDQQGWAAPVEMAAFQVDILGPNNCAFSDFSAGAGKITYQATSSLCVAGNDLPFNCNAAPIQQTLETSTITYGGLTPCCGLEITQNFF